MEVAKPPVTLQQAQQAGMQAILKATARDTLIIKRVEVLGTELERASRMDLTVHGNMSHLTKVRELWTKAVEALDALIEGKEKS